MPEAIHNRPHLGKVQVRSSFSRTYTFPSLCNHHNLRGARVFHRGVDHADFLNLRPVPVRLYRLTVPVASPG